MFGFVFIFLLLGNVLFLMEFNSVHDSKSIAGIYELDYFGITSIFNIKWGHAVNTVEQMSVELANDSTQMIEVRNQIIKSHILRLIFVIIPQSAQ